MTSYFLGEFPGRTRLEIKLEKRGSPPSILLSNPIDLPLSEMTLSYPPPSFYSNEKKQKREETVMKLHTEEK